MTDSKHPPDLGQQQAVIQMAMQAEIDNLKAELARYSMDAGAADRLKMLATLAVSAVGLDAAECAPAEVRDRIGNLRDMLSLIETRAQSLLDGRPSGGPWSQEYQRQIAAEIRDLASEALRDSGVDPEEGEAEEPRK